ncbi:hypothetical protein CL628_03125 [bacterium]|nr:hypothetical protein [bacterium]
MAKKKAARERTSSAGESKLEYFWRMIDDALLRAQVYLSRDELIARLLRRGVTTRAVALWMEEAWSELVQKHKACIAI